MTIYDFTVKNRNGEGLSLGSYKGKVLLIVNTATGCGFAPQYDGLNKLHAKYHEKGLEILAFPCNQFGNQEPGTDEEIHEACSLKHNLAFEQFAKIEVNGDNESPLYAYLKKQKGFEGIPGVKGKLLSAVVKATDKDSKKNSKIKWNFTKFLVDRSGKVVERFESPITPENMEKYVAELIEEKA